jgi:hypothetical protein
MKTKTVTFATIAAVIVAAAVAIANVRTPIGVDSVVGFGAVVALLALAAMEYRFDLRGLLGNR